MMRGKMQGYLKCHVCDGEDCEKPLEDLSYVCRDAIQCWKMVVHESDGSKRGSRGCIVNPRELMSTYCNKRLRSGNVSLTNNWGGGRFHTECCKEDLCNDGPLPTLPGTKPDETSSTTFIALAVCVPLLIIALLFVTGCLYRRRRKIRRNGPKLPKSSASEMIARLFENETVAPGFSMISLPDSTTRAPSTTITTVSYTQELLRATPAGDSTVSEYLESTSMPNGAGLPKLTQRTLAQHVHLRERLGSKINMSGSFDREVWLGICYGETVAVKIYSTRNEHIWARETDVYSNLLPSSHNNLLGYVGSDVVSQATCTHLWVVVQYHPQGSLRNYLRQLTKTLNHHQMFNLCLGIVSGLLYVHTEIKGTQGKSSMAHRNLSSRNVFVKSDGSCVLADLAYIVSQDCLMKNNDNYNVQFIAKRYLSPEMLSNSFNAKNLGDFQRADIYSLGLILWEICHMSVYDDSEPSYMDPFADVLINIEQEPMLEDMLKVVVNNQCRPPITDSWKSDTTLAAVGKIIKECWHTSAVARLPILRIKKNLVKLASKNADVNLSLD